MGFTFVANLWSSLTLARAYHVRVGSREIRRENLCAAQNYSRAAVLSALTIAVQARYSPNLRNCSIGAWLLACTANGDADGAD